MLIVAWTRKKFNRKTENCKNVDKFKIKAKQVQFYYCLFCTGKALNLAHHANRPTLRFQSNKNIGCYAFLLGPANRNGRERKENIWGKVIKN